MKPLLNTLYVTTDGAYLHRDGETITVRVKDEILIRVPIHNLQGVVCLGHISCSPPLMHLCAQRDVALSFLSPYGQFLARVQGPTTGNVLLRRQQYRLADDVSSALDLARALVIAKVLNSRTILLRANRDRQLSLPKISDSCDQLKRLLSLVRATGTVDQLRGLEGSAAKVYFSVLDELVLLQKQDFFFSGRSRRPPLDNMNAILSFLYTLLAHDVAGALEAVGLDPRVGYLHALRPGRPALALDLMEELRAYIVDRLALTLVNRQQIRGSGFIRTEGSGVVMDESTRKIVLSAYQDRKREEIIHPYLGEKVKVGLLPHVQALLFARTIRGDLDAYPPFLIR